jgi:hypothetical protein
MTAGVPWIVYSKQINEKLSKSFLTRGLNNEIEKFFVEVRAYDAGRNEERKELIRSSASRSDLPIALSPFTPCTHKTRNAQHEFVRVSEDFKSFILPFTATAFLAQLNLLLCSWSLLLKTRARLHHHSYLRHLGQKLHLRSLLRRLRAARSPSTGGAISPLEVQVVARHVPVVAEALHSAAARAKASVRKRRRKRRQSQQEQQRDEEVKAEPAGETQQ